MDLHRWVVGPGDQAEATGTVARTTTGYCIAHDLYARVGGDRVYDPAARDVVPVHSVADDAGARARLVGRRVRAVGSWDGTHLTPEVVGPAEPDTPPAAARSFDDMALPPDFIAPRVSPFVDVSAPSVRRAEAALWADGTIVDRTITETADSARVVVITHDVPRTERALRPVFGDRLDVVPSRWGRDVLAAIEAALDVADEAALLFSSGTMPGHDGYPRMTMGVRYVSREIALVLAPVPDELLTVEALLTPAGVRRPPLLGDL